ncbi:MAG: family 78 glycoside hydrolase catalytic domain, partial [Clostridia bacterium]|nr:family 78 glycoside hydrolase catalytic domain [Clostridia bacterium]
LGYAPVLMGDIFEGEAYDARINTDWMQADYNDAGWLRTAVSADFSGAISTSLGVEVYAREDLERTVQSGYIYEGVTNKTADQYGVVKKTAELGEEAFTLKPGQTAILDFGQNFVGREEVTVSGAAGAQIRMRHAEMLNESKGSKSRGNDGPEGSLYLVALRGADATARYTLSGVETETYHSTHSFYGFRYLEITATEEVTIHQVRGQVLTSALEDTGSLVTGDADVNQLLSNIHWGLYGNYLSVPTDCPQRNERNGWAADTQVFSVAAGYLNNSKEFLRTYLQSMRDTQRADGAYASVSPMGSFGNNFGALGWADAGVIVTYELYKQYGDVEILREMYDSMQLYIDGYLASTEKKGGAHNYGDWLAYESNDTEIKNMLAVSYYAYDALLMSEMATALGKTEDAARYLEVYETEKEYFIEQFVQEDGTLKRSEQSVCLYALYLDLLPDEASFAAVKKQLTDNIRAKGNKLQTGFLGTKIILETLTEIGETELAYKLLLQHENPSWLYTVDQGATTMWERWNSFSVENGFGEASMNSFNHYAYGAVAGWMYRYMAGIVPVEGYKTFTLQPHPDRSLGSADATYESVYGTIKSAWNYEGDTFRYSCTVPANTTATVMVPVADLATLQGGDAEGLTFIEQKDGYAVYTAVAGSYSFTVQSPAGESTVNIAVNNADESVPAYLEYNGEKVKLSAAVEVVEGATVTLTAKAYNDVDYQMVWFDEAGKELGAETVTLTAATARKLTVKPILIGAENIALGATVTANSTVNSAWGAANLTDGVLIHTSSAASGWSSASDGKNITTLVTPKTLVVDLGSKKTFDQWKLYPRTNGIADPTVIYCFPVAYTVEISDDNSTWTTVATVTESTVPQSIYQPAVGTLAEAKSGRYLRFTVTAINSCDDYQNSHVQLSELAVCYASSEEVSTNLALGAGLTVSSNNGGTWDKQYLNDGATVGTATACGWSTQKLGVGTSATEPATLPTAVTATFDFGTETTFNQWKMYPRNHDLTVARMFPINYTVAVSDDNATWTTVATITDGEVPAVVTDPAVVTLDQFVSGRYVKFTFTKINLPDTWKNNLHVQLTELEIFGDPAVNALREYKALFEALEPSHFEGGEQITAWLEKTADAETLIAEAEALLATLKLKDQAPMGAKYLHYCDNFETASEWLVADAADLVALEQYSKAHALEGFTFTQTADISMKDIEGYIGIGGQAANFAGTYDGGHYTITDLAINFTGNYVNSNGVGLFANANGATIRNVRLLNSTVSVLLPVDTVSGDDYGVGGIVGRAVNGTLIENCHNGADVTLAISDGSEKDLSVAGIAGRATAASKILNCVNSGDVTAAKHVSGITDWGQNGANMAYIINCVNMGQLSGASRYAIARYNDLTSSYLYSYSRYSNNYWLAGSADSATNRDANLATAATFEAGAIADGSLAALLEQNSIFYATEWMVQDGLLFVGEDLFNVDLNGDLITNSADVVYLLNCINDAAEVDADLADVNGDGKISLADALRLLKMLAE